ncbi:molybdate ABC transporter substrate-binding protein [Micromonospora sp. WMMD1076]|uniref:molybdate ABC transporter substrate-binding protein n=1 Tax=Micromonospora TaxID=1873 RepID=UPI00249A9AA6|nr:molybdate ABC transporter substrate-binding protein [Micromonospora sp. WMMD1076]WFF05624.1 molybdate ABC transporter substrate-binding protein [Micromonospora sp. WMMD1076]
MTVRWIRTALAAALVAALGLTACGGPDEPSGPDGAGPVTVFAAASLTESFTKLGKEYEAAHPGSTVTFNFGGSSGLATQITQGAPADVFAAASPATMKTVTDAGDAAGEPAVLVRNQLVVAVPPGNPARVGGLADLARPGVKVALCAEQVPCGAAARTALDAAGVRLTPATLEQDVKGALAKLRLGEVDAALVYRTDVRAAPELDAVEFPESARAVNDYPIVVLRAAGNPAAARAFVDFVRSDAGLAVLTAAGFQAPPGA